MCAERSEQSAAKPGASLARCRDLVSIPSVVLIGASTGGPQALTALVAGLVSPGLRVPVCVTLHMPAELMPVIATHVTRTCGVETRVVTEAQSLFAGIVYFSPGDRHVNFRKEGGIVSLDLVSSAPGEFCKPAVDVMFTTGAACFGARTLAVVLSGMGKDGLAGARAITAAGGSVLVQDKASCAVWGMPGCIAKAELAAAVMSPEGLAAEISRRLRLARPS